MSLIGLLIAVVVVGLVIWAIEQLAPLPHPFPVVIRVIGVVIVLLLLLQFLGVLGVDGVYLRR